MTYSVELAESAKTDIVVIREWAFEKAADSVALWFDNLMDALHSLKSLPYRCPTGQGDFVHPVPGVWPKAWILHIRHGSRKDLKVN